LNLQQLLSLFPILPGTGFLPNPARKAREPATAAGAPDMAAFPS
jgi:hypothetical protein